MAAVTGAGEGRAAERAAGRPLRWRRTPGLLRRALVTFRHLLGLAAGGYLAWVEGRRRRPWDLPGLVVRGAAALLRPWLLPELRDRPFPEQLRRRFEMLGPTYIKLGQVLSVRRDLLPEPVTAELARLLDHVPPTPFEQIRRIVELDLGRPLEEAFLAVDPEPIGSASIAQTHRATTFAGEDVILKVVKPGVRDTLRRDLALLRIVGRLLERLAPSLEPRRIIEEFCRYTLREADMVAEAEHAETFAANFADLPEVVFPRVYRELSGRDVLCMEWIEGIPADAAALAELDLETRRRLVEIGAEAVIRMVYRDGFFHADLHPANLRIQPGPRLGFIDLGMVGRLDDGVRRALLYHVYSLVLGDVEGAVRHIAAVAEPGRGADPAGFRREVASIIRRWREPGQARLSLAEVILLSVREGARHRMYFPVELVLMVKALVTYEGMGMLLDPEFDAVEVASRHVLRVFRQQFSPARLAREGLKGVPDLVEALIRLPELVGEGMRELERRRQPPGETPLAGLRGTLYGGFCLVAGAILAGVGAPWPVWTALLVLGLLVPLRRE